MMDFLIGAIRSGTWNHLIHPLQMRVLEKRRILQPIAEGTIPSDMRKPNKRKPPDSEPVLA